MPKAYQPEAAEPAVRERWTRARAFAADPAPVLSGEKKPYTILIPPPNVTAKLHLGHALNNTIQDVLARRKRMQGYETLWQPGADHAGIATQTVVEKKLLETEGRKRTDFEREAFVEKVRAWKDQYEAEIRGQLLAMGCSCDFDRWRFTMDDQCARAVRESFFRLFKEGLIYRGKRLVNWDPVTQTALADDEVEMREVEGHFYYLKYPLAEPFTDDAGTRWEHVTVATTRPETYLGDTAVAMNPADPRAAALEGKHVTLPLVGRVIPIIQDDYVVMPAEDPDAPGVDVKAKYATGFLKVTPAHDPNDWEIGRRHDLEAINVMAPDGSISDRHGWDDVGDAGRFVRMSREDARAATVKALEELGLVEKIVDYSHSVGHSYRSHAPIEPYLSDQWYVKVSDDRLRGAAQRALATDQRTTDTFPADPGTPGDSAVRFHPDRYSKTYESWHDNLRDWCISRQLWWGHRIPVWTNTTGAMPEDVYTELATTIGKWLDDGRAWYIHPGEQMDVDDPGQFTVCVRREDDAEIIDYLEAKGFERDPDVLDTWYSSALWPLSTLGWPDDTDLLRAFNPTDVLCTARDIITLWVSRMVMFNRLFKGQDGEPDQPFHDVYIHAMIQDGEGRRMSKSLGNGVDPLDIIHSHGADAMRFTLCQMTTQTQDARLPVETDPETGRNTSPKFDLGKRFCNKLWNASRFTMMMLSEAEDGAAEQPLTLADRWMLSRLTTAACAADEALESYQFSQYAETMYDLLWRDFCDWYLEAVKPTVRSNRTQQAILRNTLDTILRLLHPMCPFVTEAIYEHLRSAPDAGATAGVTLGDSELLCRAPWPTVSADLKDAQAEKAFDRLRGLIEAVRDVRATQGLSHKVALTIHGAGELAGAVRDAGGLVETIANIEGVTTDAPEGPALALAFEGSELKLTGHAASAEDAGAQKERLEKQIGELKGSIKALEGRLNNPGYVNKAPEHLVSETRAQLASKQEELAAAEAALADLG